MICYLCTHRKLPIREIHLDKLLGELGISQEEVCKRCTLQVKLLTDYIIFVHSSLTCVFCLAVTIVTQ